MSPRFLPAWLPLLAVGLAVGCSGCTGDSAGGPVAPAIVVVGTPTERNDLQDDLVFEGHTEAVDSVEVRARVNGYLDAVLFKPGAEVTAGAPLFQIDPRPYEAQLKSALGEVEKAKKHLERLESDYRRAEFSFDRKSISREEFDKVAGDRAEAAGSLKAAEANVRSHELDVEFCSIKAKISGRTSNNKIAAHNLVTADTTILTTIVTIDKMYAWFDVDEATMLRVQKLMREGRVKSSEEYEVDMRLENEKGFPHHGHIDFVDNVLDPSTGTLQVRAIFPNKDRSLTSGEFCLVHLKLGAPYKGLVVPERAILTRQKSKYVLVVGKDNVVEYRPVELGALKDGMRVITSGLKGDEQIIISDPQRAREGITVAPRTAKVEAGPAATEKSAAPPTTH